MKQPDPNCRKCNGKGVWYSQTWGYSSACVCTKQADDCQACDGTGRVNDRTQGYYVTCKVCGGTGFPPKGDTDASES